MNFCATVRVSCGQERAQRGLERLHGDLTTNDAAGGATSRTGQAMDADLLRRVQADDLDAFEEFFARYRSSIYRTAYGLTGDRQAAEEVLQDTFARAYQRRHTLHSDVSPLPWLHRVSLNLCYSRLSLQETAEVLGIQLGTVKSRLHYALRNLRVHLERDRRFGGAYLAPTDEVEANAS